MDALPAAEEGLDQSADIVLGGFLPSHASMVSDGLEVLITLRRVGLGVGARHRHGAGWHASSTRTSSTNASTSANLSRFP
jgi:hypothetical protein